MNEKTSVKYDIIGHIQTPFKEKKGIPIQPIFSQATGTVKIFPKYSPGLSDLSGFSHIILIYHFHQVKEYRLRITPFLDIVERGIFATRGPLRPNPIGISIVELSSVDIANHELSVIGIDVLDNTPLLDIKPYIPQFDHCKAKSGWISERKSDFPKMMSSDGRF
jgi:tRNA-Thr(GGU) m(6)t(6)A37 methyltransferase TsaA